MRFPSTPLQTVLIDLTQSLALSGVLFSLIFLTGCKFNPSFSADQPLVSGQTSPQPAPQVSNSPSHPPLPSVPNSPAGSSGGKGSLGISPGQSKERSLNPSDLRTRYYVHVPTGYRETEPIGMVYLFHGVEGTNDPVGFFINVRNQVNDERFLLVAPAGDVEDGGSGAWCQPFAAEVFEAVRSAFNVDNSRQYLVAVSGGTYPAMAFALTSEKKTYTNPCDQPMKVGFQSEFAVVAFTAPASNPMDPILGGIRLTSASTVGLTPTFWADYGENSGNGPNATSLVNWAKQNGYGPTQLVVRKGEGHTPEPPFTYLQTLFDTFEKTQKP